MRNWRPKFSLRLIMLTIASCCVFLALDNAVQRQALAFEATAVTEPEKLRLEPYEMDGTPTIEVNVSDDSSLIDQILFRRRFRLRYSGYVKTGNTRLNLDDVLAYRITIGGFRRLNE